MRLAAEIWVAAYLRRVEGAGASGYVRRRGADGGGAVALKFAALGGPPHQAAATALTRVAALEGGLAWSWLVGPEPAPEAEVDARLARQAAFDQDLWVIEVEDREGRRFLDDPILD